MSLNRILDEKDIAILELLEEDAWLTHVQIGERVHLSASAVQRRIEKLRSNGVIRGAKAVLDKRQMGKGLRVYLVLELNDDSRGSLERIVSDLEGYDEVVSVDLVSGKFDLVMALDCTDTESFTEFAMDRLNSNPNIRHCWTLMRLKNLF